MNKVIGLDLGTKTLGIAKSDALGFVHGVETFRFPANQYIVARQHVLEVVKTIGTKEIALPVTPTNLWARFETHRSSCPSLSKSIQQAAMQ